MFMNNCVELASRIGKAQAQNVLITKLLHKSEAALAGHYSQLCGLGDTVE